jgi:hypothetical protein
MRSILCTLLILVLTSQLTACDDTPPSASLGPIEELQISVDTSDAKLVSGIDLAMHLECLTTIPDFATPGAHGETHWLSTDISRRRDGDLLSIQVSADQRYTATSPPKRHLFAKHYCQAFARIFVSYPGASDIKTGVPGGRSADNWFPAELGLVGPIDAGAHDFTATLVERVGGKYKLRCKHGGTSAGEPVDTLELLVWSAEHARWESRGNLLTSLERPCQEPREHE